MARVGRELVDRPRRTCKSAGAVVEQQLVELCLQPYHGILCHDGKLEGHWADNAQQRDAYCYSKREITVLGYEKIGSRKSRAF